MIGNAVMVAKIATGEIEETAELRSAADELRSKGGKARASNMTAQQRKATAKKAARARWQASPIPVEEE